MSVKSLFKNKYWRRKWQPTPVFLPGKSHGWRSLAGYSPWGHKESDMTERLYFISLHFTSLHSSVGQIGTISVLSISLSSERSTVQFSSVAQSCATLCDPMDHGTPSLPVHHQLPEFTQTHVHWVSDAIQPSHPLTSPSPLALNLSQHQGLFKWVSSLHQVAKVLEFQIHHQFSQWIFRTDFL